MGEDDNTNAMKVDPLKIVAYDEYLTGLLNSWRKRLIQATVDFHEAMNRRNQNPQAMIPTQSGEMSITSIAERRLTLVTEARSFVEVLTKMLEEYKASEDQLAFRWSDDALIIPKNN